jgi:hypothetical protein
MTSRTALRVQPDTRAASAEVDRPAPVREPATAESRWLRLGLAGLLGVAAGTMLFPTRAQGRTETRRQPPR